MSSAVKYSLISGLIWTEKWNTGMANRPLKSNSTRNWNRDLGMKLTRTPGTTLDLITLTNRTLWQRTPSLSAIAGGRYDILTPWTTRPNRLAAPLMMIDALCWVDFIQLLLATEVPPLHVHPFSCSHFELQPSPSLVLPSSHWNSNLLPSPQISAQ